MNIHEQFNTYAFHGILRCWVMLHAGFFELTISQWLRVSLFFNNILFEPSDTPSLQAAPVAAG